MYVGQQAPPPWQQLAACEDESFSVFIYGEAKLEL